MVSQIDFITQLLSGFIEEKTKLDEQIKKTGFVPKKMCNACKVENKRVIENFTHKENVQKFVEWLRKFHIISLDKDVFSEIFRIKTSEKIGRLRKYEEDETGFTYYLLRHDDTSALVKNLFSIKYNRTFFSKYEKIETCQHFDLDHPFVLKLKYTKSIRQLIPDSNYKLVLCCEECKNIYENTMCDTIKPKPFYYDFECNTSDILLRTRLEENKIDLTDFEQKYQYRERMNNSGYFIRSGTYYSGKYYIPEYSILISLSRHNGFDDFLTYLDPELIVILFGSEKSLPSYLKYNKNILFVNEDGVHLYDKNKKVETNIQNICNNILQHLNDRINDQRGNDHDRIISALNVIGSELGFVTQTEYSQSGVRIDLVWHDREGTIQVAGEVETSSTWKKDLISTWEVEPKLAIIVGFPKTDRVVKNLMNLTLMKYVPHPVLYINKYMDTAYLFNKQEIIKYYTISKKLDDKDDEINII